MSEEYQRENISVDCGSMFGPAHEVRICTLHVGHEGEHYGPLVQMAGTDRRHITESQIAKDCQKLVPMQQAPKIVMESVKVPKPEPPMDGKRGPFDSEILDMLFESNQLQIAVHEACHHYVRLGTEEALDKASKLIEYQKLLLKKPKARA